MGTIREQVEEKFDEEIDTNQFLSFEKFCITRWTTRATCFQKMINALFLSLWEETLSDKVDAETLVRTELKAPNHK